MKINKDSLVCKIGPFETNIKLGYLIDTFKELYDANASLSICIDNADEIIEKINEWGEYSIRGDEYLIELPIWDENNLHCRANGNGGCEGLIDVLEKVFGEEFYYMRSDRFFWNVKEEYVKDPNLKIFISKIFVVTDFSFNKNEKCIITKDHDYNSVREINESNFLTKDEKIMVDRFDNDKVGKNFNAKYNYYYIRKKDFNKEKWWLGWTWEYD